MIGVLGGMGPMATADFLSKLVIATPATQDRDHIPVIVQSIPQVPDRTSAILGEGPSPLPEMISMASKVKAAGAEFGVIACNTAHHWYDELVYASQLEFIHIADAVLNVLEKQQDKSSLIGLMATPGTIKSGFYQERLTRSGFRIHAPDSNALLRIHAGIKHVKANELEIGYSILSREIDEFHKLGVETIILGCTELSVIFEDSDKFIDSNLALAKACVVRSAYHH